MISQRAAIRPFGHKMKSELWEAARQITFDDTFCYHAEHKIQYLRLLFVFFLLFEFVNACIWSYACGSISPNKSDACRSGERAQISQIYSQMSWRADFNHPEEKENFSDHLWLVFTCPSYCIARHFVSLSKIQTPTSPSRAPESPENLRTSIGRKVQRKWKFVGPKNWQCDGTTMRKQHRNK